MIGSFDSYVQEAQEATMREKYAEYLEWCAHSDSQPKSFTDFCHDQERREPYATR